MSQNFMENKMSPPYIIIDSSNSMEIYVADSVYEDCYGKYIPAGAIEANDVSDGEYTGYDSMGRLLKLETVDDKGNVAPAYQADDKKIRIRLSEEKSIHAEYIKNMLKKQLIEYYHETEITLKDKEISDLAILHKYYQDLIDSKNLKNIHKMFFIILLIIISLLLYVWL
jgi:hypothetical protein